jgi:methane/ammonia monooxygenase subunit C
MSVKIVKIWCFNMGVVVAFMGAFAYEVRVYTRLVGLLVGNYQQRTQYIAKMYKPTLREAIQQIYFIE